MTPFAAYRLLFTPLSPIHIGTGHTYEPTNYVIDGDTLHEFDHSAIAETLSFDDRHQLADIVNASPDDTMLQAVQRFFYDRRDRLIPWAVHRMPVQPGVAGLYTSRVGKTAQREASGRPVINRLEIDRTVYHPVTHSPVLLGSSVKGAIRTALLDSVNGGRPTTEQKGLHDFQGKADLFRYKDNGLRLERDPMRLVHLSDAEWKGEAGLPAAEVVFAVNRKKSPVVDRHGNPRGSRAESGPPQIFECIPPLRNRAFSGQLNIQLLNGVDRSGQVPAADLRFDIDRIARACTTFYRPILEREIQWLSQKGWLDDQWGQTIQGILSDALNQNRTAFLLRVGRHCGAESVTLNGVRKIKISQGPGRGSMERSEATTLWLAAKAREDESDLLPFGWVLVEFVRLDDGLKHDNGMVKALCDQYLGAARQWADRLKAKEPEWERARQAAKAVAAAEAAQPPRSRWVDDKLRELCAKPGITPDDALRGKTLAEAVRAMEDEKVRQEALTDIRDRWKAKGWWDARLSGSAKQAKAIYDELLGQGPVA
ncbi:MAG: RAMP superfamily CRISPR-associated protein [Nitrospiraceae bacterium]